MKQESSKKSKTVVSNKFYDGKRRIYFPSELFIELTLSPKQVEKVRGWEKDGHSVMPMWFTNCERVLFLDQERFEEWLLGQTSSLQLRSLKQTFNPQSEKGKR
jgi:hypothetical protein